MLAPPSSATGAMSARDRLVHDHVRLAARLARRYDNGTAAGPELTARALAGLERAAESFEPDDDADFFAFAIPIIVSELKDHYRGEVWTAGPEATAALLSRIDAMLEEVGPAARLSAQDVAVALEVSLEEVVDALALIDTAGVAAELERGGDAFAGRLSSRERLIYRLRYGCGLGAAEIAATLGIGLARVQCILLIALDELGLGATVVAPGTARSRG